MLSGDETGAPPSEPTVTERSYAGYAGWPILALAIGLILVGLAVLASGPALLVPDRAHRAGLPDGIANAAVFLASDESSFINGHDLVVDGAITGGRNWTAQQQGLAALRKAFSPSFPETSATQLFDYKVRVLDGHDGTAAVVRVLIESGDHQRRWSTVGCSTNIIEASWTALADAFEYSILRARRSRDASAASA